MKTYVEEFDESPGGWIKVVDNWHVPARLSVKDGAIWCYGPWWVDYNHAPPGGGIPATTHVPEHAGDQIGEVPREVGGTNRFVADSFPTDFTNASMKIRLRGELEQAGTNLALLIQGTQRTASARDGCLPVQPIRVQKEYTETTLKLEPDPRQWTSLGSRHDRRETYGTKPLEKVLASVNVNIYLVMFPVKPRPMGPIDGDPHILRAGRDYSNLAFEHSVQGYVAFDRVQIDFQESK